MDDKVIVVQLDNLMQKDRLDAFRKSLVKQMEDGLIVIPPWAHVAYVGDKCTIEIKEQKKVPSNTDKIAKQILADIAGMSVDDDLHAICNRIIFGKDQNDEQITGKWELPKVSYHNWEEDRR